MSLLGSDAIGRVALGGAPRASITNTIFSAQPASYALAGRATVFGYQTVLSPGTFAWSGNGSGFKTVVSGFSVSYAVAATATVTSIGFSVAPGTMGLTGRSAFATAIMASSNAAYVASGRAARCISSISAQSGAYVISAEDAELVRGFDNWFVLPDDADQWTGYVSPEDTWLSARMQTNDWSVEPSADPAWTTRSVPADAWKKNEPTDRTD